MPRCEYLQLVIVEAPLRGVRRGGWGQWPAKGKRARYAWQEEQIAIVNTLQSAPHKSPVWLSFHCLTITSPPSMLLSAAHRCQYGNNEITGCRSRVLTQMPCTSLTFRLTRHRSSAGAHTGRMVASTVSSRHMSVLAVIARTILCC